MWDLAIPTDRPKFSVQNAWALDTSIGTSSFLPESNGDSDLHPVKAQLSSVAFAKTAEVSGCSQGRLEKLTSGQMALLASMSTKRSTPEIATLSVSACIAHSRMTSTPVTELFTAIQSEQTEWVEQQKRKIEALYLLNLERNLK